MNAPVLAPSHTIIAWRTLVDHIESNFAAPDIEALRIVLSAVSGHYAAQADPVWLFIIGPSGCGKSAIHINAASALPSTFVMGDITAQTLISGTKGYKGFLHEYIQGSGIMLFKDFTTVISKRHEDRAEIAAQLREAHDGSYSRQTGRRFIEPWVGKLTVIAAVTPELDNQWSLMRGLGERFLNVRLQRGDGLGAAAKARQQRGREKDIIKKLKEHVEAFIKVGTLPCPGQLSDVLSKRCEALAEITAKLRAFVPRTNGSGPICGEPYPELPTRISKSLTYVVASHAAMFRREPTEEDLHLAVRLAMDSSQPARAALFQCIPDGAQIGSSELAQMANVPRGSLDRHIENMQACGVVSPVIKDLCDNNFYRLTAEMEHLKRIAFPASS